MCNLSFRYEKIVPTEVKDLAVVFDLESAVMLLSKFSVGNNMVSHIKRADRIEWETYGATEFEAFYKAVCNLPQVKDLCVKQPDLHLFGHDINIVYRKYKHVLQDLLWGSTYNGNSGQIFVEE